MKDFFKIFFVLAGIAAAFLFGRSHGEKTFRDGTDFRQVLKSNEELNFARGELENIKAKLQNVADGAANKKTDVLLAEIFQVLQNDLGVKVKNQEEILKKAAAPAPAAPKVAEAAVEKVKTEEKQKSEAWARTSVKKFKSFEWMVANASGASGAMSGLKKVQIRNIASFLKEADEDRDCESFYGSYKGSVKNIDDKYFGSLEFQLKNNAEDQLRGKVSWYNNDNAFSEKIKDNCGKKISGLSGRVFSISKDKYVQLYKLSNADKTAGNFYEVLPNGTTKIIGSFVLNRVDKF